MRNTNVLDVDLSTGRIRRTELPPEFTRKYVGGMGFSNKILYDQVGPEVDALAAENVLIFAPGALTGSSLPQSCRTEITTKHPETGSIGTGNTGGVWGMHLKRSGFDVLVVRGQAERPVYLRINNDDVVIKDAAHLWGKDTYQTTQILEDELSVKAPVIAIGAAGENLVPFACAITERHHGANRNGAGAVMGSKKLKAIVVYGSGRLSPARPEAFRAALREAMEREEHSRRAMTMPGGYTGGLDALKRYVERGGLRVKNYQAGYLPGFLETRGRQVTSTFDNGQRSCYACPARCFEIGEVKEGKYAGTVVARPTFAGFIASFGGLCAIDNVPAILKCKELCQRSGMDYVAVSGVLAFAMELFQRGIITQADTDGLDLGWGNEDSAVELIGKMARREGFGAVLANGSVAAAATIGRGAERYAMTMKGVELMCGDPRAHQKLYVLGDITNPRGGDNIKGGHNATDPDTYDPNWWVDQFDMTESVKKAVFKTSPDEISSTWEGKALYCKWLQDLYQAQNALGVNMTGRLAVGPAHLSRLYTAYTGWDTSPDDIMECGERVFNLFKAYAVRQGQGRKDDNLPSRFYDEPLPDGPQQGAVLSRDTIEPVLDEYYEARGWDKQSGAPTRAKLDGLGLADVARDLERNGKLPR